MTEREAFLQDCRWLLNRMATEPPYSEEPAYLAWREEAKTALRQIVEHAEVRP